VLQACVPLRFAALERGLVAKISDILTRGTSYSFEFFPPRSPEAEATLETVGDSIAARRNPTERAAGARTRLST